MGERFERVRTFLEDDGWDVEADAADGVLYVTAEADNGTYDVVIAIDEDAERIMVWAVSPETVPPPARTPVALYVTRVNHGLAIGNLELDLDAGEVRCKASADLEGVELGDALLGNLLAAAVELLDVYLPGVREVVGGADPAEAAARADAS